MAHHVTASAVANNLSIPNTSCDDDVVAVVSKVDSSESVCIHSNYIHSSKLHTYVRS